MFTAPEEELCTLEASLAFLPPCADFLFLLRDTCGRCLAKAEQAARMFIEETQKSFRSSTGALKLSDVTHALEGCCQEHPRLSMRTGPEQLANIS